MVPVGTLITALAALTTVSCARSAVSQQLVAEAQSDQARLKPGAAHEIAAAAINTDWRQHSLSVLGSNIFHLNGDNRSVTPTGADGAERGATFTSRTAAQPAVAISHVNNGIADIGWYRKYGIKPVAMQPSPAAGAHKPPKATASSFLCRASRDGQPAPNRQPTNAGPIAPSTIGAASIEPSTSIASVAASGEPSEHPAVSTEPSISISVVSTETNTSASSAVPLLLETDASSKGGEGSSNDFEGSSNDFVPFILMWICIALGLQVKSLSQHKQVRKQREQQWQECHRQWQQRNQQLQQQLQQQHAQHQQQLKQLCSRGNQLLAQQRAKFEQQPVPESVRARVNQSHHELMAKQKAALQAGFQQHLRCTATRVQQWHNERMARQEARLRAEMQVPSLGVFAVTGAAQSRPNAAEREGPRRRMRGKRGGRCNRGGSCNALVNAAVTKEIGPEPVVAPEDEAQTCEGCTHAEQLTVQDERACEMDASSKPEHVHCHHCGRVAHVGENTTCSSCGELIDDERQLRRLAKRPFGVQFGVRTKVHANIARSDPYAWARLEPVESYEERWGTRADMSSLLELELLAAAAAASAEPAAPEPAAPEPAAPEPAAPEPAAPEPAAPETTAAETTAAETTAPEPAAPEPAAPQPATIEREPEPEQPEREAAAFSPGGTAVDAYEPLPMETGGIGARAHTRHASRRDSADSVGVRVRMRRAAARQAAGAAEGAGRHTQGGAG